jgi:heparan-alpha-glucosaminide N-acetyltransferase
VSASVARRPSLDVLRGTLVALLLVVEWSGAGTGFAWLRHAPWAGIRLADVVFPGFLFLVGTSAAVSSGRAPARDLRRAITLVLLGLVLMGPWERPDLSALRLTGVLQMIGLAGLLAAAIVAACRRRAAAITLVTVVLVAAHAATLSFVPLACGTGSLDPGCSTSWSLDRALLGVEHLYHQGALGHDPEGLLNIVFGATALVLLGWLAGRALDDRRAQAGVVALAALAGGASLLAFPLMKRVWTPSFTLVIAAGAALALFALASLDDRPPRRPRPVRWTLTALGRNALFVYIGQHLVLEALFATPSGERTLAGALTEHLGSALTMGLVGLVAWTAVAAAMHATRWYVSV